MIIRSISFITMDNDNNVTTRLLTLLNVSALKSSKRKREDEVEPGPRDKLNKRRTVQFSDVEMSPPNVEKENGVFIAETVDHVEISNQVAEDEAEEEVEGIWTVLFLKSIVSYFLQMASKIFTRHTLEMIQLT